MSERYIENIACPTCGNKDSLGVWQREDDSYHAKCFDIECGVHINDPYEGSSPTERSEDFFKDETERFKTAFTNIENLGYNDLKSRGITKDICELYNVKSRVDPDGNDLVHYYEQTNNGEVSAYMERRVQDKKFINIGNIGTPEFFGQRVAGSSGKMIVITEGQLDTLSAKQMFLEEGKNYRVVSVPNGASSAVKCFKDNYEWVSSFETIVLAFDMDDPGRLSAEKVGALFEPNRVKSMFMSEKDPNEMLRQGKSREFLSDLFNAKESFPDGILSVEDLYEEAIKPPELGLSFPFPTLSNSTYGYRRRELYGVGAGSGCGKSLVSGSKVRMHNGAVKTVEDIKINDLVLNSTGSYSKVIGLGCGSSPAYRVSHSDGTFYECNDEHILSVINSKCKPTNIFIKDAIGKTLYGYNSSVNFNYKSEGMIPPYILGIWLGDGHNNCASLTCGDKEVLSEWSNYGISIGLVPTEYSGEVNCKRINLSKPKNVYTNTLYSLLKLYRLPFNKHIPDDYLYADKKARLELLAGLLDTDGSLNSSKTCYEITTKSERLGNDISNLARSLGFRVRHTIRIINTREYQKLRITGELLTIPIRVVRKKSNRISISKSRITSIEEIGIRDYFGFVLEGDKRFCLENYTVTHNTECFKEFIDHTVFHHKLPVGIIFLEEPAARTLKVLAGKHCNRRFHIPDGDWTVDQLVDGINAMKGMAYFYNHSGAKDWESIKAKIKYMVRSLGIKDIYLDHLTALVAQEENEYKALNKIMEELSSLTHELDCTIFYISHLRKAVGTPHEEGGHVSADQFKGSGAIVFWTNFIFGLERNQQALDFDERNTTTFRVLKDRNTGLATGLTFRLTIRLLLRNSLVK